MMVSCRVRQGTAMRNMYVADLDLTQGRGNVPDTDSRPIQVPSMDTISSMDSMDLPPSESRSTALALARDNESLREELDYVQTQLTRSHEDVQQLQMQLADRERTLQATKADLIETRLELQRTEDQLQEVNDRLLTATNERSEYRQYLLEAQAELQSTREELMEWSEGLTELKSVMEGLDEDLSDLFGEGEHSGMFSEAMSIARDKFDSASSRREEEAARQEQIATALQGLTELSAEVLRQAREDRKLFEESE